MTLQQIVDRIFDWFVTVREIDKVERLDDHLLADMGIKRREIARRIKGR